MTKSLTALMGGTLLRKPEQVRSQYGLMVLDYNTDQYDDNTVRHCYFTDETIMSALTEEAYKIVTQYFDNDRNVERTVLPQPDGGKLIIGTYDQEGVVQFIIGADDNPDQSLLQMERFIDELNEFSMDIS